MDQVSCRPSAPVLGLKATGGGRGKAALPAAPRMPREREEQFIRAFASAI
ncbi:hypothetical protein DB31_8410 [Hyalangium minutum]|uniref:Uncharacterized protein n=1 Tax=Hyalangium minutum TaxID=394096 RepID=A0A085WH94_9BACT|nr:hypothetical protein DB31_8410 [Hyalangium minutum]